MEENEKLYVRDPREITETYQRNMAPREVVLTYQRGEENPEIPPDETVEPKRSVRPRRKKRGVLVFLCAIAVFVGISLGCWAYEGGAGQGGSNNGDILWNDVIQDEDGAHISIERAEHGVGVSVAVSEAEPQGLTIQEIYEKVNRSTVTVVATEDGISASIGTGVILTEDGYILTNTHVIEDSKSCSVLLSTGQKLEAKLVGYDADRDIAVLKVAGENLPAAAIGKSGELSVGDTVYAIGNPLGLELRGTLTDGIVSAINRDVDVKGRTMTLIQTNAAINPGNSGGPLINVYGEVVGINTIKMCSDSYTVEGLGFAIPSYDFIHMTNQILEYGYVLPECRLGITVTPVDMGNDVAGVMVYAVSAGSCSAAAGIRQGDIILKADGETITSSEELLAVRRNHAPGETMTLEIYRDGETITADIILDAAE